MINAFLHIKDIKCRMSVDYVEKEILKNLHLYGLCFNLCSLISDPKIIFTNLIKCAIKTRTWQGQKLDALPRRHRQGWTSPDNKISRALAWDMF